MNPSNNSESYSQGNSLAEIYDGLGQRTFIGAEVVTHKARSYTLSYPVSVDRVVSRWWIRKKNHLCKSFLLAECINGLEKQVCLPVSQILLSKISMGPEDSWTEVRYNAMPFEKYCLLLSERGDKAIIRYHDLLLKFLAKCHLANTSQLLIKWRNDLGLSQSLNMFYRQRLKDIMESLVFLSLNYSNILLPLESILDIAYQFESEVDSLVDSSERVAEIHGDFNPSNNILIEVGVNGNRLIIIDFEQGIIGGDPIVDIWKLRVSYSSGRLKYLVISPNDRNNLLKVYTSIVVGYGWILTDTELLKKRISLIRFEQLASVLIAKLILESSGIKHMPNAESVLKLILK